MLFKTSKTAMFPAIVSLGSGLALATALCVAIVPTPSWAASATSGTVVWLDELPLADMTCGWNEPKKNKSVEGNSLQIGSKTFARGVGTHAKSLVIYRVDGKAVAFDANVGIDVEAFSDGSRDASVKFIVKADGRTVAETDVMKDKAESIHLHADLAGYRAPKGYPCADCPKSRAKHAERE